MKRICLIIGFLTCSTLWAQQSIGFINVKLLFDTIPSRKEALIKLEMCRKDENTVLQEMQKEFEECHLKSFRGCMTPILLQLEEDKLRKQQQDIEKRQAEIEHLLQKYSEELNKPILDRIQKAIEIVADRKKLSYVIDESATLYFKGGIDCTAEAIIEVLKLDAEAIK